VFFLSGAQDSRLIVVSAPGRASLGIWRANAVRGSLTRCSRSGLVWSAWIVVCEAKLVVKRVFRNKEVAFWPHRVRMKKARRQSHSGVLSPEVAGLAFVATMRFRGRFFSSPSARARGMSTAMASSTRRTCWTCWPTGVRARAVSLRRAAVAGRLRKNCSGCGAFPAAAMVSSTGRSQPKRWAGVWIVPPRMPNLPLVICLICYVRKKESKL